MKARPRSVERKVAAYLSTYFVAVGWKPVERIPVLGRTGPDISINESGLVIDVKSRLSTPKAIIIQPNTELEFEDGLVGIRLAELDHLFCPQAYRRAAARSFKSILDWWSHMDEWTRIEAPDAVSALVLHRPGMDIKNSLVVIHSDQRSVLYGKTAVR